MSRPQAHQLTTLAVFLLIVAGYATLLYGWPSAYVIGTYEDLYGEWSQWVFYVAVLLICVWLALRPSPCRWFYILLAVATFYAAGEEISWGQRLLGFSSPEFFEDHNLQEETNLHNFLTGPVDTWTNDLMQYAVAAALLGYGLVYPLLLRLGWGLARWVRGLGVPAPPLELAPFFSVAAVLEMGLFHFNEAEVAEILIGCALLFMVAGHAVRIRQGPVDAPLDASHSRSLAGTLALLAAAVVLLSVAITQWDLQDPERRAVIDERVLNGYNKYGLRFGELGLWTRAADLYTRAYEAQTDRTDLLEKLAESWQMAGNDTQYRKYAKLLLERSLKPGQRWSRSVAQQLSVAESYREIGDAADVALHMDYALRIATEEAAARPEDPEAAYTLGMVYEVQRDYGKSREYYARARDLLPTEARYSMGFERVDGYLRQAP